MTLWGTVANLFFLFAAFLLGNLWGRWRTNGDWLESVAKLRRGRGL